MRSRIGLTGGIGSGKSTVAGLFADKGAYIVDADLIAREVVAPGSEGLQKLVEAFGNGVVTAEGELDRAALADIAFASPEAKAKLDAITHPLIVARTAELFSMAPEDAIVVHDVALLTELGMAEHYDAVIVVDADDELRVQRLIDRGLREEDARARISHQATREQRLAIADYVITNHGTKEDLAAQVDEIWARLTAS